MRVTVKPAARPAPRRAAGVPAGSATPQQPAPAAPAQARAPAAPQSQAPQTTAPPSADPASTTAAAVSDVVEQVRVPVAPLDGVETTVSAVAPPVGEVVGDVRAALTPKQP
jgi:predicted lipid-binding transport protein (Tim44 family)